MSKVARVLLWPFRAMCGWALGLVAVFYLLREVFSAPVDDSVGWD